MSPDGSKLLFVVDGGRNWIGTTAATFFLSKTHTVTPNGRDLTQLTHYGAATDADVVAG